MSRLPPFRLCIIAEQVRPEPDGKSTIIGFLGVAPEVVFSVPKFPSLMNVSAFVICGKSSDSSAIDIEVEVLGPAGILFPRTKNTLPQTRPDSNVSCALNFQMLPLVGPGEYHVRIFSEGELHSDSFFMATAQDK